MSNLHNFGIQNFSLVGRRNKALNLNFPGNVLIMFKMQGCRLCASIEPQYYQLANSDRRVEYGIVDLSSYQNKSIVNMSRETKTPISATPHIVFYSEGRPYAKFTGKYNIQSIQSFVSKIVPRLPPPQAANQFVNPQYQRQQGGGNNMYGSGMGSIVGPKGSGQQTYDNRKLYQPEIGSAPNMGGVIKGNGKDHYSYVNNSEIEDDEEIQMLLPPDVTPYTKPWETIYKKDTQY